MSSASLAAPTTLEGPSQPEDTDSVLMRSRSSTESDDLPLRLMDRLDLGFPEPASSETLYPKATADIDQVDADIHQIIQTKRHVVSRRHLHSVELQQNANYAAKMGDFRSPEMEERFQAMNTVMRTNRETYDKLDAVCKAMTQLKHRVRHRSRRTKVSGMTSLQWIMAQRRQQKEKSSTEAENEDQESSVEFPRPASRNSGRTSNRSELLQRSDTFSSGSIPGVVEDMATGHNGDFA